MRIMCPGLTFVGLSLVVVAPVCWAQLPEVSEEAIEALGITEGTRQSNGFVFVEGCYIAPPYTVTRKGNGIFINRVQVEQPFPWTAETLTPAIADPTKKRGAEPGKGDAEKENYLSDGREQEAGGGASDVRVVPVAGSPAAVSTGNTLDALFDEGPARSATEEQQTAVPGKQAASVSLTQKQKAELCQNLDMRRLRFETGLAQGEIFLFNYRYGRINGTYGTAKTLFAVLPEAVRYAQSPQDLMARLNQGGVYFLDINACTDLYRNKLNFMALSARRRSIEVSEAKKAQLRPR